MADRTPITVVGKQKLEDELKNLLQVQRPDVIKAIEDARALGDLSENADYDAAKERQGWIEARIAEIQTIIATADVVDPADIKEDKIVFGATVTLVDVESDEESSYQIVGVQEADVKAGKISIESPLARALIGKRVDDPIEVKNPKGIKEYEVVRFEYK